MKTNDKQQNILFGNSGQTSHRASRYFLCLARNVKKYLLTFFGWFNLLELWIFKKARVRATAADLVTGQILVETMVALAMVTIGLLGMLNLLSSSIGINKVVSDQYVASYLASEGIEIVKNMIDNNVAANLQYNLGLNTGSYQVDYDSNSLLADTGRMLQFDGGSGGTMKYTYNPKGASPSQTSFRRTIDISNQGDEMIVKSTIDWVTRGGSNLEIVLEDHFYNWRQ